MKSSLENGSVGGPKNHGYASYDLQKDRCADDFQKNQFKFKGVMDTVASNRKVNFDELHNLILESYKERSFEGNPPNVTVTLNSLLSFQTLSLNQFTINIGIQKDGILDKKLSLTSKVREKQYRVFFDKRVIDKESFKTFPFGYRLSTPSN